MTGIRLLSVMLLAGTLGWSAAPVLAQEGVPFKAAATPGSYCHMKFPAMREETLNSNRPVLKEAGTSDVIDFYGPCDHDPLGKEEVLVQRTQHHRQLQRDAAD